MAIIKKNSHRDDNPNQRRIEDLLRSVGPSVFMVHEDRIPPGHYWLGREYTLGVSEEAYKFEFRRMKHRVHGPALYWFDGTREEWYQFDKHHRIDGPAIIRKTERGTHLSYMEHGLPHRYGGPAIIGPGRIEQWYWYGRLHREDGPAVVHADGSEQYYIDGVELSIAEHRDWLSRNEGYPFTIW